MTKIISSEKLPIKMWTSDPFEDGALQQAKNLANLPFLFKHVALMPDCHQGYGMPIGGVIATKGVIIPNAVGVDIGCGMLAVRTELTSIDQDDLKKIMGLIREAVPVGFEHHQSAQNEKLMPDLPAGRDSLWIVHLEYKSALKQLGTLGGGNHFIEIQKGSDGFIWVMIHSGSRNLGKKVADHYNKIAVKLNERWYSSIPRSHELAFLPIETDEAKSYKSEMDYCVDFALANRTLMAVKILNCIETVVNQRVIFEEAINISHNYARWENHFGHDVIVHRKGATSARDGEIGIIPGSQGTPSYIVKGLGNPESFQSCSHGAGRKMGRNQAQKELSLEAEIKRMNDMGIIHGIRNVSDLDEAPGAYKDINVVINNQLDLTEPIVTLTPIAVIKG